MDKFYILINKKWIVACLTIILFLISAITFFILGYLSIKLFTYFIPNFLDILVLWLILAVLVFLYSKLLYSIYVIFDYFLSFINY